MEATRPRNSIKRLTPAFCLLVTAAFSLSIATAQDQQNLDTAIEEIDQLISAEDITTAKEKLSEIMTLGIRDERIDMLNGRLRLFDSMGTEPAKPSLDQSSAITQQDRLTATDLFDSLRVALENGELNQITEFSEPSQSTSALLQALFANYATMEIKLSDTSTDATSQSFFATLEFVELKTDSGDTAYPADAWKTHELRVTKTPGDWRKVRW